MTDKDSHTTAGECDIMFTGMRKCFSRSALGRWSPYWLDDLHVPHRWVRSNSWPVWELLVSGGFTVEAVGEGAQLETVSVWEEMEQVRKQEGKQITENEKKAASAQKQEAPVEGEKKSRNLRLFSFPY